jgi:hypothetical protein
MISTASPQGDARGLWLSRDSICFASRHPGVRISPGPPISCLRRAHGGTVDAAGLSPAGRSKSGGGSNPSGRTSLFISTGLVLQAVGGPLAQRESVRFTPGRSVVQIHQGLPILQNHQGRSYLSVSEADGKVTDGTNFSNPSDAPVAKSVDALV